MCVVTYSNMQKGQKQKELPKQLSAQNLFLTIANCLKTVRVTKVEVRHML